MSIFIKWTEAPTGTRDQFLVSLFSSLSSRYYPTNVIGSGLHDILSMYAEEFVDIYDETQQTFDDLSIDTVRTSNIITRNTSKMFDNFGVLLKSSRRFEQFFNNFSSVSVIQSYRQQLRFLSSAFIEGISVAGLENLGRSFTGIAPVIQQHIKANPRWILTAHSGSVLAVGENFIISDISIPRIGNVLPVNNASIFSPGDNFTMSFTHLGTNTKLSGEDLFYNSIVNTYYIKSSGISSQSIIDFKDDIEFQTLRQIRADQRLRASYSENFEYYRPYLAYSESVGGSGDGIGVAGTVSTLSSDLDIHSLGFLYNIGRIHSTGSVHFTPVIDLGDQYNQFKWHYDWMVNTREHGSFSVEVRQYVSASIPDAIYYIPIVNTSNALPPALPEISGSVKAHWFNVQSQSVFDVHGLNTLNALSVPAHTPILSRDPRRHCYFYDSSITFSSITGSAHPELDFSTSMYAEMWLLRLQAGLGLDNQAFSIKRQQGTDHYNIYIDTINKTLNLALNDSGGLGVASASIASYLDLDFKIPHYFAVSYTSGSVLFFADGEQIGSGIISSPSSIPSLPLGTQSIIMNISDIGIDEILLSNGNIDEIIVKENFLDTRSRRTGVGIPSGSVQRYHQAKFTFNGFNNRDIELQQFSIRGIQSGLIEKYLNPYYNYPYVLPLFKKI